MEWRRQGSFLPSETDCLYPLGTRIVRAGHRDVLAEPLLLVGLTPHMLIYVVGDRNVFGQRSVQCGKTDAPSIRIGRGDPQQASSSVPQLSVDDGALE